MGWLDDDTFHPPWRRRFNDKYDTRLRNIQWDKAQFRKRVEDGLRGGVALLVIFFLVGAGVFGGVWVIMKLIDARH